MEILMEVAIRGNNLSAPTKSVSPSNTGYNRDNQYQVMTSDLVMVAVMVILAENVSQKSHNMLCKIFIACIQNL